MGIMHSPPPKSACTAGYFKPKPMYFSERVCPFIYIFGYLRNPHQFALSSISLSLKSTPFVSYFIGKVEIKDLKTFL